MKSNNNFYVIPQLQLDKGELRCRPNGKRALREVHFQQGALDGACGVYSFLMALGILGVFDPQDITVDSLQSLSALYQRFVRELNNHGLYRKGLGGKEIKVMLESFYKRKIAVDYLKNEKESFLQDIIDYLDGCVPPILSIFNRRRKFAHWVLAVGYQYGEDDELSRFLILDPGVRCPQMALWNGVLTLSDDASSCEYATLDNTNGNTIKVIIEDALAISKLPNKR